jgi:hypothetical protein
MFQCQRRNIWLKEYPAMSRMGTRYSSSDTETYYKADGFGGVLGLGNYNSLSDTEKPFSFMW